MMTPLHPLQPAPSIEGLPEIDATVVVCSYNRRAWLLEALDSIRNQSVPSEVEWEVIAVDNGSTDGTWEALELLAEEWPRLRPVREPRPGKSFALNTAICNARGRVMAFTDDDVVADRFWLWNVISSFERFDASMIGGRVLPLWMTERPSWFREREFRGVIAHWEHGEVPFRIENPAIVPSGNNLSARTEVLRRYGGFHTGLGAGRAHRGADSELGVRLLRGGEVIMYTPEPVVYHRVTPKLLRKSHVRRWFFRRGMAHSVMEAPTENGMPKILRIPRWRYRIMLVTAWQYATALVKGDFDAAFYHETRLWMLLGFAAERWGFYA
jgi:glycosyltransferase involved in cell wall biosynthesis